MTSNISFLPSPLRVLFSVTCGFLFQRVPTLLVWLWWCFQVLLEPEVIGRSGSDAYGWARGKYYAVAPYAEDGVVSRCGKV